MDIFYLSKEGLSHFISSLLNKFSKKEHLHTKNQIEDFPTKLSEFDNDLNFDNITYNEIDPTVPAWAKAASKPTYTKSEVGLGNVDNVKQYSANNPPPYPVTSVNGQTGAVTVNVPTRSVVTQPTDQSIVTYFKISNFGTWHGLATNEKVSLLIGTRSGETILFTLAGENATTMGASALRLNDRYSKISGIYYKISENAIYVSLAAWGNILSVDVLSDKSGNYTPIVEQISALPTDATDAAVDAKLISVPIIPFGSHYSNGIVVGNTAQNLALGGKNARPTYNGADMALKSDIPAKTDTWTATYKDGTVETIEVFVK